MSEMEARSPDGGLTQAAVEVVSEEPTPVRQEVRRMGGLRALDAALLLKMNRLPHTAASDKYIALVSELGRGVGWAALCGWLALSGGRRGRRVGLRSYRRHAGRERDRPGTDEAILRPRASLSRRP